MTVLTIPALDQSDQQSARLTGRRIAAAEWHKFSHTRSTWVLFGLFLVFGVGLSALAALVMEPDQLSPNPATLNPLQTGDLLLNLITATPLSITGIFLATLFGALPLTSEFSSGAIRSTLAAAPRRLSLLLGKLTVTAGLGSLVILLNTGFSAAIWLSRWSSQMNFELSAAGLSQAIIGTVFYQVAMTALVLQCAAIIRSTAGTISLILGLVLVLDPLIRAVQIDWLQQAANWLPWAVFARVPVIDHTSQFAGGAWGALAAAIAWLVAVGGLAGWIFKRRDA